jgi:hypothetical protein
LIDRLYDQLRQRLSDDFFKNALLKQVDDDAFAGVVVVSTCTVSGKWLCFKMLCAPVYIRSQMFDTLDKGISLAQ